MEMSFGSLVGIKTQQILNKDNFIPRMYYCTFELYTSNDYRYIFWKLQICQAEDDIEQTSKSLCAQ